MYELRIILLVIHIASAAIIFAAPMGNGPSLRRALASGDGGILRSAAKDAQARSGLSGIGSLVTLLTGIALIFVMGGFGAVRPQIHAALALMLLTLGFNFGFMNPAGKKLVAAAQGETFDKPAYEAAVKKLAIGTGIVHLLWLIMLVLMVYK